MLRWNKTLVPEPQGGGNGPAEETNSKGFVYTAEDLPSNWDTSAEVITPSSALLDTTQIRGDILIGRSS